MAMTFRVELVWTGDGGDDDNNKGGGDGKGAASASSIYLTKDGRVVLQGRAVSAEDRALLDLPADAGLISVDHALIRAIKEML